MSDDNLILDVLRGIRDEIRTVVSRVGETNDRLDQTINRLDQTVDRLNQTVDRLNFLAEGQIRLRTELTALKTEVKRQGERFERFLLTEGRVMRGLARRVTNIERHLGLPLGTETD